MKNLLINPPSYTYEEIQSGEYPIALLKLSTLLRSMGEETELFDFQPFKGFGAYQRELNYKNNYELLNYTKDDPVYRAHKSQAHGKYKNAYCR